ncbi:MAG: 50S ribosomal protein L1 [Mycoplasmataceae bacterium]|nr:50S ribosomal protein L1 [Mycoplasmataceae bacterium]
MAKKLSKNLTAANAKVEAEKLYTIEEAIKLAQEASFEKFDATIDLAFKLNLDVRQADQQLRGAVALPNGTGKSIIILAATDDSEQQKAANAAGAEIVVGAAELNEILATGKFNFDVIVADPKMMPSLGRHGKTLGPKGLMPNPKTGTVTPQVGKAIEELKKGKANYRTDKQGIVHTIIGKKSMDTKNLIENAAVIIETINKLKPSVVKGKYLQSLTLSSTMGPAIKIKLDK